ncbi:WD40 repeat protein [Giardia muris]|uniref:WD40 repeat protein n=1 Tax=Giardia muris TaxID=5742 RepID=A0A4Z1T0M3_GIAMU|nr:WD40 repeat protein [Giardia muris]|eukprot:TNJ27453.1 WD40 repeat protein [Giardia muris]
MLTQIDCKGKLISAATSGSYTFVGLATDQVRCFNWKTGRLVRGYECHAGPVTCILLSADRRHMYTGSWDRMILKIAIQEKALSTTTIFATGPNETSHDDFVKAMIFGPGEEVIYSASGDGKVYSWPIGEHARALAATDSSSQEVSPYLIPKVLQVSKRAVESLCLLPLAADGHTLIAATTSDNAVVIIDGTTMVVVYTLKRHPSNVQHVRFAGELLWTACADNTIRAFELPLDLFRIEGLGVPEERQKRETLALQRETLIHSLDVGDWVLDWDFTDDESLLNKQGYIVVGLRNKRLLFLGLAGGLQVVRSQKKFFDGVSAVNVVYQMISHITGEVPTLMVVCASWDHFIRRFYCDPDHEDENTEISDVSLSDSEESRRIVQEIQDARLRAMLQPDDA